MLRYVLMAGLFAAFASAASAQLSLLIERNAGSGTPVPLANNSRLVVPLNFDVSSLDLRGVASHTSPPGNVTLTTTFAGVAISGVQAGEWAAGPAAPPVEITPTSGTFSTVGTMEIEFTADDTVSQVSTTVFIDVVNAPQFLSTGLTGNNFGGAMTTSAMFDLTTSTNAVNVTDIWATFSTLIGGGTSDVSIYVRTGTYVGNETSSAGWALHETFTGVQAAHLGNPVRLPLTTPIALSPSTTYGITIAATNSPNGPFCTGAAGTFSSSNLTITTGAIVGDPFLGGATTVTPNRTISMYLGYEVPAAPEPEIDVQRPYGTSLGDASGGPVTDDIGTILPSTSINNIFLYNIRNLGSAVLNIASVQIMNETLVTATVQSAPVSVAPGGESNAVIRVTAPSATGNGSFTIRIASNDANEANYDIDVTVAVADAPIIDVRTLGDVALSNNSTKTVLILLDNGSLPATDVERIRIHNLGTADLDVSGLSINNEDGVSVIASPQTFTVAAGPGSQEVVLDLSSLTKVDFSFELVISSNDPNTPSFVLQFQGAEFIPGKSGEKDDKACSTAEGGSPLTAGVVSVAALAVLLRRRRTAPGCQ